ncbi:hypothetical protein [Chitinophaga deserti]|uniref:hypothetical protein n=1 Tax=Chitinophaga deserti TaxID=2164099 RepID=UPI001300ADFF|nr:hypothetical protein [Chitinophaga deserti]
MLSRTLSFCLLAIGFFSCKKSEILNPPPITRVDSVSIRYTKQGSLVTPVPGAIPGDMKYALLWSGHAAVARWGVFTPGSGTTWGSFTYMLYDGVEYAKDTIFIRTYSLMASSVVPTNIRKIVVQRGRLHMLINTTTGETTQFYFKGKDKLAYTEKRRNNIMTRTEYLHDNKGNVKTITIDKYENERLFAHEVTVFLEYDDKLNPLKGLILWEDMLDRAQSDNNPLRGYQHGYHENGGLRGEYRSTFTYNYKYTPKGYADFSQ